ncbi:MAG: hypothetical protein Q9164_004184 [Protoblastenia rupestris]
MLVQIPTNTQSFSSAWEEWNNTTSAKRRAASALHLRAQLASQKKGWSPVPDGKGSKRQRNMDEEASTPKTTKRRKAAEQQDRVASAAHASTDAGTNVGKSTEHASQAKGLGYPVEYAGLGGENTTSSQTRPGDESEYNLDLGGQRKVCASLGRRPFQSQRDTITTTKAEERGPMVKTRKRSAQARKTPTPKKKLKITESTQKTSIKAALPRHHMRTRAAGSAERLELP